ncbi:unnamed protein product [Albugo candida]|uniref:Uncharacterized protein n=1 Tax=Albugo candida TaxID=65357 RepID=A0A024GLY5_9STRA|nr:unnamed protein product [Albugo candida]|eukprot:CCI47880.1 unnamed protein product [Albugo candida]
MITKKNNNKSPTKKTGTNDKHLASGFPNVVTLNRRERKQRKIFAGGALFAKKWKKYSSTAMCFTYIFLAFLELKLILTICTHRPSRNILIFNSDLILIILVWRKSSRTTTSSYKYR